MAKMSVGGCRIRDVVRDSKIHLDDLSEINQNFDADYMSPTRTRFPRAHNGEISNIHRSNLENVHGGLRHSGSHAFKPEMKLPTFDGSSRKLDFLDWIDMFEDYFDALDPPEAVKCNLVASKLKGEANIWWEELQNVRFSKGKNLITSWERMRKLLLNKFLPTSRLTYLYNQQNKPENEDEGKHANCSMECSSQIYNGSQATEVRLKEVIDGKFALGSCSTEVLNQFSKLIQEGEVKQLMVNDSAHNKCPTLCHQQSIQDKQEEKVASSSKEDDVLSTGRADSCMPLMCLTKFPNQQDKREEAGKWTEVQPTSFVATSNIMKAVIVDEQKARAGHGADTKHNVNTSENGKKLGCTTKIDDAKNEESRKQSHLKSNNIELLVGEVLMVNFDPGGARDNDQFRERWRALIVNNERCVERLLHEPPSRYDKALELSFDPGGMWQNAVNLDDSLRNMKLVYLYFDAFESLPPEPSKSSGSKYLNTLYDTHISVLGSNIRMTLRDVMVIVVGFGAPEGELLSNLSSMGVSQHGKIGKLADFDDYIIDKGNPNKQIVFRKWSFEQVKRMVALLTVASKIWEFHIIALQGRVDPKAGNVFGDAFWENPGVVVDVLDNATALNLLVGFITNVEVGVLRLEKLRVSKLEGLVFKGRFELVTTLGLNEAIEYGVVDAKNNLKEVELHIAQTYCQKKILEMGGEWMIVGVVIVSWTDPTTLLGDTIVGIDEVFKKTLKNTIKRKRGQDAIVILTIRVLCVGLSSSLVGEEKSSGPRGLQDMVKMFQQGNIATVMAVLSAYSMLNQIEHVSDTVLNMESGGLALDVVFYIELYHRLCEEGMIEINILFGKKGSGYGAHPSLMHSPLIIYSTIMTCTLKMPHVTISGCIGMHALNWDFMWLQAMFLELLSVRTAYCIYSLGRMFLKLVSDGLILELLQNQI